jgi:methanethiol S-methyltransferase
VTETPGVATPGANRNAQPRESEMARILAFLFGLSAYATGVATILYAIGFVGNMRVPKSIDSGVSGSFAGALAVDLPLIALFTLQHSGMARTGFKRWWTRVVPPSIERSAYVLCAALALQLLFWLWRPIDAPVWTVTNPAAATALLAIFWLGWAILIFSTFLIDHFALLGVRQVFDPLLGRKAPDLRFRTPLLYRLVRHPIYVGLLLGFWATPAMTAGHLLFAAVTTAYILIAIPFEEGDLASRYGDEYRQYRDTVRMLVPIPRRKP